MTLLCVCASVSECTSVWVPVETKRGVSGDCELPDVGAENGSPDPLQDQQVLSAWSRAPPPNFWMQVAQASLQLVMRLRPGTPSLCLHLPGLDQAPAPPSSGKCRLSSRSAHTVSSVLPLATRDFSTREREWPGLLLGVAGSSPAALGNFSLDPHNPPRPHLQDTSKDSQRRGPGRSLWVCAHRSS